MSAVQFAVIPCWDSIDTCIATHNLRRGSWTARWWWALSMSWTASLKRGRSGWCAHTCFCLTCVVAPLAH